MSYINYYPEFTTATGQPFIIRDTNRQNVRDAVDAQRASAKQAGIPFVLDEGLLPTEELDFAGAIIWFLNDVIPNLPDPEDERKPITLTPEYAGRAYEVIKAFQYPSNNQVEIDPTTYAWLIEMVDTYGFQAFKVTQAVVADRIRHECPPRKEGAMEDADASHS